ncbi:MAG: Mut7-C RNAse domain-containing protein [Acidimicrobiia bacterium]
MTGTVTIRVYAELNDFLAPDPRQRDASYRFDVAPSVKDAIEALGVPHTEVDLILVNGEPADFRYRLVDGDRVSVYPAFEGIDISELPRLRPEPLDETRFVVDGHLGTLGRYLRLLGFDTRLDPTATDEQLADASVSEQRVLLTRDRGVLKRRAVTHGFFVRDDDPTQQLLDVVRRLHLGEHVRPFSRCMVCNGLLEDVDKDAIEDQLRAGTRLAFHTYRRCQICRRLYWEGAHHPRLRALVAEVRALERGRR